jgi:LemA protein
MSVLWLPSVIIGTACVLALFVLVRYNALVGSRNRVHEAWLAVDAQLRHRSNLIPIVVEAVRGYAAHERRVFDQIARARLTLQQASRAADAGPANDLMTAALGRVLAVAEQYPQLRASHSFTSLGNDLRAIEEQIAFARERYNRNVLDYNRRVETYPEAFFAHAFNFMPDDLFEVAEEAHGALRASYPPAA